MAPKKNILILGGTGPTGIITVRTALERGHNVTVFARSPQKLPETIRSNTSLTIVTGELSDTKLLYSIIPKVDAIISLLGPNKLPHPKLLFTTFYRDLLAHLHTLQSPPRLVALSTLTAPDPNDGFDFTASLIVWFIYIVLHSVYNDIVSIADVFRKEGTGLEWVLFRVARLLNGVGKGAKAGYIGKDGWNVRMDMADIADFAIKEVEVEKSQWLGKVPAIW